MKCITVFFAAALCFAACNNDLPTTGPQDEAPYFTNVSTTAVGDNIRISRRYSLSFDTTSYKIEKHSDSSSFDCSGSTCKWQYTVQNDTNLQMHIEYLPIDSQRSTRSIQYSFFDAENDSCEARIELADDSGKRFAPDSVWGDVYSRPGENKTLSFAFHGIFSYASLNIYVTLVQIDDVSKSCQATISDFKNSNDTDLSNLAVTDDDYFRMIEGKWRLIIQGSGHLNASWIFGGYALTNVEYVITRDSLYCYSDDTLAASFGMLQECTSVWSTGIMKQVGDAHLPYPFLTLVGRDTLVNIGSEGMDEKWDYLAILVRDTSNR